MMTTTACQVAAQAGQGFQASPSASTGPSKSSEGAELSQAAMGQISYIYIYIRQCHIVL